MMMYEHAACLAYGLANVMTAQLAGDRVFPARHTFEAFGVLLRFAPLPGTFNCVHVHLYCICCQL